MVVKKSRVGLETSPSLVIVASLCEWQIIKRGKTQIKTNLDKKDGGDNICVNLFDGLNFWQENKENDFK